MGFPLTPFQTEKEEAPVLKAKAKKAKPEEATIKAKAEVETITTEEGLIKFMEEEGLLKAKAKALTTEEEEALIKFVALLEKEEDFLDAKAEAEKCGSKRKQPELERDEEGAAFLAWIESTKPPTDQVEYSDGDVSDGYDSQDDPKTNIGRVMARHILANNARWPFLIGGGQIKSPEDADGV